VGSRLVAQSGQNIGERIQSADSRIDALKIRCLSLIARSRARWGRPALRTAAGLLIAALAVVAGVAHRVYFDRTGTPDLEAFIRFEPPVIGEVKDVNGRVLIELAREYRRVVVFDEVPLVLRHAILAAEDKTFFKHSGAEYRSFPRALQKAAAHSLRAWWKDAPGSWVRFPQGGSTITQQLVRGYFLHSLTKRENGPALLADGLRSRLIATVLGVSATNKLYRKLEELRLTFWLEEEMQRRFGSKARAKEEIFARYASFIYMGHGRYGFSAASEYYFDKPLANYTTEDAGRAALLAGIPKSPRDYAPSAGDARARRRRDHILAAMASNGFIPAALAGRYQAEPIVVAQRSAETEAPAAIDHVFDELSEHGQDRFSIDDLIEGRISVRTTVLGRAQAIVNQALETGLALYEKRHPQTRGLIQGSVVVLRNADASILAETGGRKLYNDRATRYSDLNRVTGSLRQPGSVWKPLVYLAAFRHGLELGSTVPDEPIAVSMGNDGSLKWIANYDKKFKGLMPLRQAFAESRNGVAVWITQTIGLESVIRTARDLGIRTPIRPFITSALGASEMRLLELAGVYRAMASGILAEPHIVSEVTDLSGRALYQTPQTTRDIRSTGITLDQLRQVQEGLRGVIRLTSGTGHSLDDRSFPIPVMGKTGTTSAFRDALFVGSTYGRSGITVAVRIGFDDNRTLGDNETGGRVALPIFREIMLRIYEANLVGPVPRFPLRIEQGIDEYLALQRLLESEPAILLTGFVTPTVLP